MGKKKKLLRRKKSCSDVYQTKIFATVITTKICFGGLPFSLLISHMVLGFFNISVHTAIMRMTDNSEAETNQISGKEII